MIAYFYEYDKLYIGKVGFISYISAYFSKKGRYIKLKNIKGLEEYTYFPYGEYVLCNINTLKYINYYGEFIVDHKKVIDILREKGIVK